jgi:hypothetical protein
MTSRPIDAHSRKPTARQNSATGVPQTETPARRTRVCIVQVALVIVVDTEASFVSINLAARTANGAKKNVPSGMRVWGDGSPRTARPEHLWVVPFCRANLQRQHAASKPV